MDPLSLFFTGLILLVSLPSMVHMIGYLHGEYTGGRIAAAWALMIGFVASMLLVVTASNALFFLIAWEIMSLLSYFLVVFDSEHDKSVKAGLIYIVMTHVGTAFITAAFLILYHHAGSFDLGAFRAVVPALAPQTKGFLFLLFLAGFGTKAGIVPLHVWLPYAHPQAPSPASAVMSGVMIKTAIYGLLRFVVYILGADTRWWGSLVLILAAVSCLTGIIYALMEHDIKRLLAYSSVENIGIILLGVGASMFLTAAGKPVLGILALSAGLYHTLNHAIFKSLLFLGAGNVYKATGLRDMEKLGGLITRMPWTAATFLVGAMAISALPPFNGFVSEWLTFQSLFFGALSGPGSTKIFMSLCAAALALTGGLAAGCFVKAFGITFLAMPRGNKAAEAKEVALSMILPAIFLALCALVAGLAAAPILEYFKTVASFTLGLDAPGISFTINNSILAPQPGSGTLLSSPLTALLIVAAILAAHFALRFSCRKRTVTPGLTWGCGYYSLGARTEYTSIAFSKPFRIAFSFLLQPYRKTKKIKDSPYHVKVMTYEVYTTPIIKQYLYASTLRLLLRSARMLRRLQTGRIHIYIAYIFITLVLLILFL